MPHFLSLVNFCDCKYTLQQGGHWHIWILLLKKIVSNYWVRQISQLDTVADTYTCKNTPLQTRPKASEEQRLRV